MTKQFSKSDRTDEIKALWESTPKGVIETGLSEDIDTVVEMALECMNWVVDFQLKYKDEFRPLTGLDTIINEDKS